MGTNIGRGSPRNLPKEDHDSCESWAWSLLFCKSQTIAGSEVARLFFDVFRFSVLVRFMLIARRCLLGLLIALGLARGVGYFLYVWAYLGSPLESFHLEAKMVLLAYRAQHGLTLYPSWRDYPHVSNFYGPLYFGLVGLLGRGLGAEIPGLFGVGRAISFAAGLATSLVVGGITARRYGWGSGVAGGLLSVSIGSMIGFSVMTRPDMAAEFLGVVGFFLAIGSNKIVRLSGGLVLILAIFTKQTAAIFPVAAMLGLVAEGNWRIGLKLGVSVALGVGTIVGLVDWGVAPNFANSLMGDSQTPWSLSTWTRTLTRFVASSPDALFFPVLGLVLWTVGATGRRERSLAVLAAVLLVTSVVTSAKRGADINYCLSLRVVECLAVGALWRSWELIRSHWRSGILLILALLGCLTAAPGVVMIWQEAQGGWNLNRFLRSSYGRAMQGYHSDLQAVAANPGERLLTDSGMLELYQGDRAAFGDPFLFRIMVDMGRIDPTLMRDRIDSGYYGMVVTTSAIEEPSYSTYEFGLPMTLAERVRARYRRVGVEGGLFLYQPRPTASP